MAGATLALSLTQGAAAGCGSSARPPALGDDLQATTDAAAGFVFDAPPPEPTCDLGPEAGVCACVDEPLVGDPPNLYFVLDRSGSMNEGNKWRTVQTVLGQLVIDLGPRATIGAAVFPDPTSADSCAPGVEVLAPRAGDAPAGHAGPTAIALLTALGHISANGGTPTAATFQSLGPHLERIAGLPDRVARRVESAGLVEPPPHKTYVILATDGGPNCNAAATCGLDQCQPNIESVQGCQPDKPPNCCQEAQFGGALSCEDSQPTIDAVRTLSTAGIPVYVVGVPGSEPYATLLDELAVAGGTSRGSEPQYYAVNTADQAALAAVISKIAAQITGSCTLQLSSVSIDPAHINVFLGGQVLPQSGPDGSGHDGWTISPDDGTVTILGASCAKITGGDVLDVRVVAGCPTVLL